VLAACNSLSRRSGYVSRVFPKGISGIRLGVFPSAFLLRSFLRAARHGGPPCSKRLSQVNHARLREFPALFTNGTKTLRWRLSRLHGARRWRRKLHHRTGPIRIAREPRRIPGLALETHVFRSGGFFR